MQTKSGDDRGNHFIKLLDRVGWSARELARRVGVGDSSASVWRHRGNPPESVIEYLSTLASLIESIEPPRLRSRAVPIAKRAKKQQPQRTRKNVKLL